MHDLKNKHLDKECKCFWLSSDKLMTHTDHRFFNIALILIVIIMFVAVCFLSKVDVLWPYDKYSNINALVAGENFYRYGFLKLHLLPVHYKGDLTDNPDYYLHYPPLAEIVNGLVRKVGIESLAIMRFMCGTVFVAGAIFLYFGLRRILGDLVSLCSISFLLFSVYFYGYSVNLYHYSYNFFFLGLFFWLFFRALCDDGSEKNCWVTLWFVFLLQSLTSFEFILYMQVFMWGYFLIMGEFRKRLPLLIILLSAPVVGVGLHFLQNCWAIGWTAAIADGLGFGKRHGSLLSSGRWSALLKLPAFVEKTVDYYFNLSFFGVFLIVSIILTIRHRFSMLARRSVLALIISLILATISWYLIMPAHSYVHQHVVSHFLILILVLMGIFIAVMLDSIFNRKISRKERIMILLLLLLLLLRQGYDVSCKLSDPGFNIRRKHKQLAVLAKVIGSDAIADKSGLLYSSRDCEGLFSYFLHRPANPVFFESEFQGQLNALRKLLPSDWSVNYMLFLRDHANTYNEDLFYYLAGNFPAKMKRVFLPVQDEPVDIILFDICSMTLGKAVPSPLPDSVKLKQLQGIFPEWHIPGFNKRFNEIEAYHW